MTLHPLLRSSFLVSGLLTGIHGVLCMLFHLFSVLGACFLFSLSIELKYLRSCRLSAAYLEQNLIPL